MRFTHSISDHDKKERCFIWPIRRSERWLDLFRGIGTALLGGTGGNCKSQELLLSHHIPLLPARAAHETASLLQVDSERHLDAEKLFAAWHPTFDLEVSL